MNGHCRHGRKHSEQGVWQQKIDSLPLSFQVSFPVPGSVSLQLVERPSLPRAAKTQSQVQEKKPEKKAEDYQSSVARHLVQNDVTVCAVFFMSNVFSTQERMYTNIHIF